MPTHPTAPEFRLFPSLVLLLVSLIGAMLLASSFKPAPLYIADDICGTPAADGVLADPHDSHSSLAPEASNAGPMYFAGGLWSKELDLAPLAEVATRLFQPEGRLLCQSVSWDGKAIIATDVSPIQMEASGPPAMAIVSVDHAGIDPSPEFATAIQRHLKTLKDAKAVLVLAPLPGPTPRGENDFPYDWTFLMIDDKTDVFDFAIDAEPMADLPGKPGTGAIKAWLAFNEIELTQAEQVSTQNLVKRLMPYDQTKEQLRAIWALSARSPYDVLPHFQQVLTEDSSEQDHVKPFAALMLHRAMGLQADAYLDQAQASDEPVLRALAARTIGDLANVTTDPLGQLIRLAEDKTMRVRYNALVACNKIGGRHAAGVAQLVEAYEMDNAMRSLYTASMTQLLKAGEPIMADSRASRLRRMPIEQLIREERDRLACKILLERSDLPDRLIGEVIADLSKASDKPALHALLETLTHMNPRILRDRQVLLDTLVNWNAKELQAVGPHLTAMATTGTSTELQTAAAAALIQADLAIKFLGIRPVTFRGLASIKDTIKLKPWADTTTQTALNTSLIAKTRIAAIDAIKQLPTDALSKPFANDLLALARTADDIDLRFAAIRAINNLPDSLKPPNIDDLKLAKLTISSVPGTLKYDKATLTVVAGQPVELTLLNPDAMEHNLVITKPGQGQAIGLAGAALSSAVAYVPDSPDVLHATPRLKPGQSYTLRFVAASTPGKYDYVCTFPGHPAAMNGILEITAP